MLLPPFYNGPFQQPFDPSVYTFWEDFSSVGSSTTVSAATQLSAEHKWTVAAIGANTNGTYSQANPNDGLHLGAINMTTANASSGNGLSIFLGGGAAAAGFVNPNTNTFVYKVAFQVSGTVTLATYLGFGPNNAHTTLPNANTTIFCGIRYDTSKSDANLMFCSQTNGVAGNTWIDSNVAMTTGWHRFTMWGSGQGQVSMQLDNSSPVTINTVPNALMDYSTCMIFSLGSINPQLNVDYIGLQVTGLNR